MTTPISAADIQQQIPSTPQPVPPVPPVAKAGPSTNGLQINLYGNQNAFSRPPLPPTATKEWVA